MEHSTRMTSRRSGARSIKEWCADFGLTKSYFFRLRKKGLAPRLLSVGRRRFITDAASDEWELERTEGHVNAEQADAA